MTPTIHYINETEVRSCFTPENNKVVIRNRIRKVESTHLPNQTPLQDISSSKISSFIDNTEHWSGLISQFQTALKCKEDLTSSNMLKRMHIATYGLFGNLIPFFKEAIEITGCSQNINMDVLEKAYIEFQPNNELTFNPFKTTMSTIEAEITSRLNARIEASAIEQA